MKKPEILYAEAALRSPFYVIMALLRMRGCLEGASYEQTA